MIDPQIHIANIINAVGLKGHVKIKLFLSDSKLIKKIGKVTIQGFKNKLLLKYIRDQKKTVIVSFANINSRNEAEKLIGKKIFINKSQLPELKKGEYYISDLLGFEVKVYKGKKLGFVKKINNFGADDLIEVVQKNNNTFYIPLNAENIKEINVIKKNIITKPLKGIIPN